MTMARTAEYWLLLPLALGLLLLPCRRSDAGAGNTPTVVSFTLSSSTLTFPSASPTSSSSIAASENPLTVTIQFAFASNWTVTAIANGSLTSGTDSIPASSISWTGTGSGINSSGTLSSVTQVSVGSGATGGVIPLTITGTLNFNFANLWTYATGSYAQTITFTATAL